MAKLKIWRTESLTCMISPPISQVFFKLFKYPGDAWTLHLLVSWVLGVAAWRFFGNLCFFVVRRREMVFDRWCCCWNVFSVYRCINQFWGREPIWKTGFVQKAGCFKEEVVFDVSGLPSRTYLLEDAVLEACFWRRGFLEGIASGACVQDKTCEVKKGPGYLYT